MGALRAKGLQGIIKKDPFLSQCGEKKCGFYLGTMKSCKSLETFLSPKNLTYYFAVETCLDEWWVTHWEKFLSWVDAFYQVWSWNRFDGLEEARWCGRTKERICLIAGPTQILFQHQICQWLFPLNCWRPPSRNWEQVQICWWWAVPLVRAVKNQACSWPCCSASLLTSGNALYYECNVYIMHVIGNSCRFTTWTYGSAAHKRAHFHTCAHTCRQVLKQTEASTPFFPWHLLLMLIFF